MAARSSTTARGNVVFEVAGKDDVVMGMGCEASDVRKPLAAVHRIVEPGNQALFGPHEKNNFTVNVKTGKRVYLRTKGRSYVLDAEFVKKEKDATSTTASFPRQP